MNTQFVVEVKKTADFIRNQPFLMVPQRIINPNAQYHVADISASHGIGVSPHEVEALARILLPQIQAFFESEERRKEFAEWKEK